MTRVEAIQAMRNGERVTHEFFMDDEWIEMIGCCIILTEDGYEHPSDLFWADRMSESFNRGWFTVKK